MTKNELLDLMRLGEGLTLEFKRSVSADLGREVCAFANALGGHIVVGADDHGNLLGVSNINRTKSEIQSIARNVDPPIAVEIEPIENVLLVTIPPGRAKPHMVGGKFYMREAASTQQLNRDEIRDFFFKEGLIRFDEQVCRQFSLEKDFDNRKYAAFLRASRIPRGLKREDVLRNLHLLAADGVRNAGVLLFAKDPAKFFQQAVVVCAVFQGKGKAKIIDKRTVGGTLVECYTGTMVYLGEHLNTEYVIRGGPREEILELPEEALREAILNALAHRDYRLTGAIQVHIFYDRVEMLNPGSLVSGLRIEDLGHVSRPRNPLLFGLMDRMELVENVGSGIKRIRDAMNEYGLRPPVIRTAETWFSITFRRKGPDEAIESLSRKGIGEPVRPGSPIGSSKGSPITRERIITLIAANPRITSDAIASSLRITKRAVLKQTRRLKDEGLLRRIGSPRAGYWEVRDHHA